MNSEYSQFIEDYYGDSLITDTLNYSVKDSLTQGFEYFMDEFRIAVNEAVWDLETYVKWRDIRWITKF
jgi:hypothetical protein